MNFVMVDLVIHFSGCGIIAGKRRSFGCIFARAERETCILIYA